MTPDEAAALQADYIAKRRAWCEAILWPMPKRRKQIKPDPGELDLPPDEEAG